MCKHRRMVDATALRCRAWTDGLPETATIAMPSIVIVTTTWDGASAL
jgi:hypothetical protein